MHSRRRAGVAAYAAFVAFSAYAGAVGLATGALDTGATIERRFPFHSPLFAAFALAAVVGLPATALARAAWRADRRTPATATLAGVLLVGWIVVELALIRELSWLQPFYVAVGVSFVAIGRSAPRTPVSADGSLP